MRGCMCKVNITEHSAGLWDEAVRLLFPTRRLPTTWARPINVLPVTEERAGREAESMYAATPNMIGGGCWSVFYVAADSLHNIRPTWQAHLERYLSKKTIACFLTLDSCRALR